MKSTELKRLRVEVLGLSQQQFADTLGLSRTQLSRYENGAMSIPKQLVDKLKIYPQLPDVCGEKVFEPASDNQLQLRTKFHQPAAELNTIAHMLGMQQLNVSKIGKPETRALAGQLDQALAIVKDVIDRLSELDKEVLSFIEEM